MQLSNQEIFDLFVNRTDVYAIKTKNCGYKPIHKTFTPDKISKHLSGERNYGIYQLDKENKVKWICVDVDTKEGDVGKRIPFLAEDLKRKSLGTTRVFIEESNGGYHIWVCYKNGKAHAESAKLFAEVVINDSVMKNVHLEIFPKQVSLNEKRLYGNLMNMPYAVHPITGWKNTMTEV
jgi:hypothetical protein